MISKFQPNPLSGTDEKFVTGLDYSKTCEININLVIIKRAHPESRSWNYSCFFIRDLAISTVFVSDPFFPLFR